MWGCGAGRGTHIAPKNRAAAANPDEMLDLLSKHLAQHQASPHSSLQTIPKQAAEVKRGGKHEQEGEHGESRADKQIQIF